MLFVTAGIRSAALVLLTSAFCAEWSILSQADYLVKSRPPMVH